jgi:5-methylcytosine-specific restriction enzyme subunit McrC
MSTDISLHSPTRKIIIDTKYYKEALKARYDKEKINSNNLYQLFSYLINQESELDDRTLECEGILLYPVVEKGFGFSYKFENHKIRVMSINLNQEWHGIRKDLLEILA